MESNWNWQNLKFFLALARGTTLGKAAETIGSNPTTVFRRVRAFEEEITARLFVSTPQGYRLTPAGEALFQEAAAVEEKMDALGQKIGGLDNQIRGEVRLTTTDSLALTVLPPILRAFKSRYPAVNLSLNISARFFNLTKREAEIALRPGSNAPPNLFGQKLGLIHFAVYAARIYLEEKPVTHLPDELGDHSFIGLDDSLGHLPSKQWLDRWAGDETRFIRTDNMMTSGMLCNEGLGIAILPTYFERYCPNLVRVYEPPVFLGSDFWLLTHKDMKDVARVKAVRQYLAQEIIRTMSDFIGKRE